MSGFHRVSVIRVACVWTVLPNVGVAETFVAKLLGKRFFIHAAIVSGAGCENAASKDDYAPSALMGADAERARRLQERRSLVSWLAGQASPVRRAAYLGEDPYRRGRAPGLA